MSDNRDSDKRLISGVIALACAVIVTFVICAAIMGVRF